MYGMRVAQATFEHSRPAQPTTSNVDRAPFQPFVSIFQEASVEDSEGEARRKCGWNISIRLNREGRSDDFDEASSKWRSGEALRGEVVLSVIAGHMAPKKVQSLLVRAFWQSTTVYAQQGGTVLKQGMISRAVALDAARTSVNLAEYHRGYLDSGGAGTELWDVVDLVGIADEVAALEGRANHPETPTTTFTEQLTPEVPASKTFEFVFVLPTTTHSSFANSSPHAPAVREELMTFERCAPPSFDTADFRNGTVEWQVEALLRTEENSSTTATAPNLPAPAEDLPSFRTAVEDGAEHDIHGLLISTPNLLVERLKFPFEPADEHLQDFGARWIDPSASKIPTFGRDARDELGGTKLANPALSALSTQNDKWTTYGKDVILGSTGLVRNGGTLACKISLPKPAMITRHSQDLPLLMSFNYSIKPSSFLSSSKGKQKAVQIDTVTLHLYERILTRSGRAERPTMVLNEVRRQEIKMMNSEVEEGMTPLVEERTRDSINSGRSRRSSTNGDDRHLQVPPGSDAVEVQVSFDLQSHSILPASTTGDDYHRAPRAATPLRRMGLSFRTPNIEREFIIAVTVQPVAQPAFQLVRVPVQIIAGDNDEAPDFEEAITAETGALRQGGRTERVAQGIDGLPDYS